MVGAWPVVTEVQGAHTLTKVSAFPGTIMMSGCGILTNGKGTRREYCEFSLDELQVRVDTVPASLQGQPCIYRAVLPGPHIL